MLHKYKKISYDEFNEIDKSSDELMELIDGKIYNQAAPSTVHQRIVGKLFRKFGDFFDKGKCEPFISPFDVILRDEIETHKVQPDLMIICDKNGLSDKNYEGVPSLIVEVLSPATTSIDYVKKMNLYMNFGVKEYWIVSPKNKEIQIFVLKERQYVEPISKSETGIIKSVLFEDLEIDIEQIF